MGLLTLRANLALSGETGRHAVRLAVVAGLAEVMVQATGLFEGRWVVLTIFLVLKPDYTSTVYRSIQRAVGTAVGAGLGAAAAWLAHPSSVGLIVAAGIAVAAAYALFDVNYVIYSSFLTVFIVILLDIFGLPADTTAVARLTNTAVGAVLALIAYSLWPTWEGLTAQEKFARMVEVHNTYTTALLRSLAHPARTDPARLRGLQAIARRARTDAEASSDRLADEPPHSPLTPAVARTLVAVMTRLAHTELSLHALVPPQDTANGREEGGARDADAARLEALATAFDIAMITLAEAVRTLQPPGPTPRSAGSRARCATGRPRSIPVCCRSRTTWSTPSTRWRTSFGAILLHRSPGPTDAARDPAPVRAGCDAYRGGRLVA